MKVQQPTRVLTPDDPIVTVDAFPPEEGIYLVSYNFDVLDSEGFEVKEENPEANTIICMPRSCPRCRMVVTREQYKSLLTP